MSKSDAAERYNRRLEQTPLDQLPPGRDMSDLAAIGETRLSPVDAEEVARRVAVARQRWEWEDIAGRLGMTAREAQAAYGTAAERREATHPSIGERLGELWAAIIETLGGPQPQQESRRR